MFVQVCDIVSHDVRNLLLKCIPCSIPEVCKQKQTHLVNILIFYVKQRHGWMNNDTFFDVRNKIKSIVENFGNENAAKKETEDIPLIPIKWPAEAEFRDNGENEVHGVVEKPPVIRRPKSLVEFLLVSN